MHKHFEDYSRSSVFLSTLLGGYLLSAFILIGPVHAQITSDGTLQTRINRASNIFEITGGSQSGRNLFHSFLEFSVPNSSVAEFSNSLTVENIFGRVTGNFASDIQGTIKTNGGANLFLLNPNGLIFGPDAQLNIGGSFVGSTAESVQFADGTSFSTNITTSQTSPLLTVSAPTGLQFGDSPGTIINRSNASPDGAMTPLGDPVGLQVMEGQTLALIGGDVTLEGGHIDAPSGRIELGSVGKDSFVSVTSIEQGFALGYDPEGAFQDVVFREALPFGSGDIASINASGVGGSINIQGQNVTLTDGSQVFNFTTSSGNGGLTQIVASDSVVVIGFGTSLASQVGGTSPPGTSPPTIVTGNGGTLSISTKQLIVKDGAIVSTGTLSQGNAGDLIINASESIEVSGSFEVPSMSSDVPSLVIPSALTTSTDSKIDGASGEGGTLVIETGQLTVQDGAQIFSAAFGEESGGAGTLDITANSILLDQGNLTAASEFGGGGDINLQVSGTLILGNGSQITAEAGSAGVGTGTGGNISINAGAITAVPLEDSDIIADAFGGPGGNITIKAEGVFGLEVSDGQTPGNDITASSEAGVSGSISITGIADDTSAGLVTLPEQITDPSQKIATGCNAPTESRFVATGRGGVPPNPQERLQSLKPWEDLRDLSAFRRQRQTNKNIGNRGKRGNPLSNLHSSSIQEATGWQKNEQGQVMLIAQAPDPSQGAFGSAPSSCVARINESSGK